MHVCTRDFEHERVEEPGSTGAGNVDNHARVDAFESGITRPTLIKDNLIARHEVVHHYIIVEDVGDLEHLEVCDGSTVDTTVSHIGRDGECVGSAATIEAHASGKCSE